MPTTTPTCLIYNPAAGRGRAARLLAAMRSRVPPGTDFRPTKRPGHAVELATAAARDGFGRVIAAGGDGTVHEVANGLLRADVPGVRLAVLPVGSMNDYAFTLGVGAWWAARREWEELEPAAIDAGVVRATGRETFFVNGCGVGFNGMVTIESRRIRRLRGVPLYATALLRALVKHFAAPPLDIDTDGTTVHANTLALTFGLGQREGGFPLTALARLDDGLFDVLRIGDIARWELVRHFPAMLSGRLPTAHPKVHFGQCRRARVAAGAPLCVHADGELFCTPGDGVTAIEVEVLPGRLLVEAYRPASYGAGRFDAVRNARGGESRAARARAGRTTGGG